MIIESFNDKMNKAVFDTYEEEPARPHLGASQIGHPCDRYLWLNFRWAINSKHDGRILKLFKRGHSEEPIVFDDLIKAGMSIKGSQDRVVFSSHLSGSIDGIVSNVPTAEKTEHLLEIKTSSLKYFNLMLKDGVEKTKYSHFVQMQLYMYASKLDRALYVVVCKDDDRMYFERVYYKKEIAEKYIERGKRIIASERLCEPMVNASITWFECKYCDAFEFCHVTKKIKAENVNCRTCAHSTPIENHEWKCGIYSCNIETENQRKGCRSHVIHPDLVNWEFVPDKSSATDACYIINEVEKINGEHGQDSKYLLENQTVQKIVDFCEGSFV